MKRLYSRVLRWLLVLAGLGGAPMMAGCATVAGKQASAIAEKCGAQVAADVIVEVSRGLDTSEAALEADAIKYGVPLVLCIVSQLVVIPPPAETSSPSFAALAPLTDRQRNAIEFMTAHR